MYQKKKKKALLWKIAFRKRQSRSLLKDREICKWQELNKGMKFWFESEH